MKMLGMTGFAPSFEADLSGGGGTAVATPPAVAAPAAQAPVASAPAPAKSGFFKGLPLAKRQEDLAPVAVPAPAPVAAAPASPAANAPVAPAPATTDTDLLLRPMMGRHTTFTQAEEAMRRSQDEGLRLSAENKTLREASQKEIANRDSELAALRAELEIARTTPAFKELTKEDLVALWKENPAEASEYMEARRERELTVKAAKENATRNEQQRHEQLVKANEEITRNVDMMQADTKTFPKFQEMLPRMQEILKRTGGDESPLRGKVWANELFYKAALGDVYQELLAKGSEVKADAAQAAKLTSEAAAATTIAPKGDSVGSGAAVTVDPAKKADEEYRKAVLGSAPKPFFRPKQ